MLAKKDRSTSRSDLDSRRRVVRGSWSWCGHRHFLVSSNHPSCPWLFYHRLFQTSHSRECLPNHQNCSHARCSNCCCHCHLFANREIVESIRCPVTRK